MKNNVTIIYYSRFLLNSTLLFPEYSFYAFQHITFFCWFVLTNKLRLGNNAFQRKEYGPSIQHHSIQTRAFNFKQIIRTIINSIACIQVNKPPCTKLHPSVGLYMHIKFPFLNNVCTEFHHISNPFKFNIHSLYKAH